MREGEKRGVQTHKDLVVWQDAMNLVEEVYTATRHFPSEEQFGLTSQVRRAAVSVPSNIAEGAARQTSNEFIQFLYISLGSVSELETQFLIATRLRYGDFTALLMRLEVLRKMLLKLIQHRKLQRVQKRKAVS